MTTDAQISAAFSAAVDLVLKVFGDGPHLKLLEVGNQAGPGWAFRMNPTTQAINGVDPYSMNVYHNGWPAGIIGPYAGVMLANGANGNAEDEFIAWCESRQTRPIERKGAETQRREG